MGIYVPFKPDKSVSQEEMRRRIKALDLSIIKKKILLPPERRGLGWSQKRVDEIEEQYRGFLYVCWKYAGDENVPTTLVDDFWHTHILFTEKYHKDCDFLFKSYLHHRPDFKKDLSK